MENFLLAVPVRPDSHFYDPSFSMFGQPLQLVDCLQVEALMPRGGHPVRYQLPDDNGLNNHAIEFPLFYLHGARGNHRRETHACPNAKVLTRDVPNHR